MRNKISHRRRGMTAVLAMLFLTLFGTLVIGFMAATNTSIQVSANDERVGMAYLASESGMDFMRYQLAHVSIPPATPTDLVFDALYNDLQYQLNSTGNLGSMTISRSGNTISIPGGNGSISLDATGVGSFRTTITEWAGEIVVKSQGAYGGLESASRAITMDFSRQPHTTSAFDYAVASKGQILVKKGEITSIPGVDPAVATLMSAQASTDAIYISGGETGGDLNVIDGGAVTVSGGTVGGSSIPAVILANHVHEVDEPEFPTIDTTVYKQYATNTYVSNANVQQNIRVPANTNPKFNANDIVQGILYIESPNQVIFNGNFKLQGFIVMEPGALTTDSLTFKGNLTMSPLPSGTEFDSLRATSGVAVLAPNASLSMTGSSGGNVKGSVIVNTFSFAGASNLFIDQGTIMTLSPDAGAAVFDGSKAVKFSAPGANNQPKLGLTYSSYYVPEPGTYQEVLP